MDYTTEHKKEEDDNEEIITENNDEEYGGFDDVELISNEFKGIKELRDLEAIKNASLGYSAINNNTSNIYTGRINSNNHIQEKTKNNLNNVSKSSSINVDKFIQSKNSNDDEIEEKLSYEESYKRFPAKNNVNSIEDESSTQRKHEHVKRKESVRKENSDIKEEVTYPFLYRSDQKFMKMHLNQLVMTTNN